MNFIYIGSEFIKFALKTNLNILNQRFVKIQ